MKNVKFKLNKSVLDKITQQATTAYAREHQHECAKCHKPIAIQEDTPRQCTPSMRKLCKNTLAMLADRTFL